MTIPERVTIGPIVYTVEQPESIVSEEGNQNIGQIRYAEGRILIKAGMPPVKEAVTFWHELTHAILENTGQGEDNEGLVDALSYGIVDLFQRNGWTIVMGDSKESEQ